MAAQEVSQLRGKLHEAQHNAQRARDRDVAKAAEAERDQLRTRSRASDATKQAKGAGAGARVAAGGGDRGGEAGGDKTFWGRGCCSTPSVLPKSGSSRPRLPRASCARWFRQCNYCCRSKRAGRGGGVMESLLSNYAAMISSYDIVACKFPLELVVQAAYSADFLIPKSPAASGTVSSGSQVSA